MRDAVAYINSLNLELGIPLRENCPVCGGDNTFTVIKDIGGTKWNCYSATCGFGGRTTDGRLSSEELRGFLQRDEEVTGFPPPPLFQIPSEWVPAKHHEATIEYLVQNNSVDAYAARRADVRYDPVRNRHVFLNWVKGACMGAVGRKASKDSYGPKWYIYQEDLSIPFVVPQYGIAGFPNHQEGKAVGVLVEDAASACAVSCVADGIALLGTSLQAYHVPFLATYDKIIVALDPDAHNKGLDMQQYLQMCTDCKVVLIEDDLKYMNPEQIHQELGEVL